MSRAFIVAVLITNSRTYTANRTTFSDLAELTLSQIFNGPNTVIEDSKRQADTALIQMYTPISQSSLQQSE